MYVRGSNQNVLCCITVAIHNVTFSINHQDSLLKYAALQAKNIYLNDLMCIHTHTQVYLLLVILAL